MMNYAEAILDKDLSGLHNIMLIFTFSFLLFFSQNARLFLFCGRTGFLFKSVMPRAAKVKVSGHNLTIKTGTL